MISHYRRQDKDIFFGSFAIFRLMFFFIRVDVWGGFLDIPRCRCEHNELVHVRGISAHKESPDFLWNLHRFCTYVSLIISCFR